MAVITISRQYGSGGDEIADRLCQIMDYRAFDKHLIARAAAEAGLTSQEIGDFPEDNYKIRGFFDRLFSRARSVARIMAASQDLTNMRYSADDLLLNEAYTLSLVRKAVETACSLGNMVIVGRGGQVILKDRPDVLHVRIVAPMEDRIQHIKSQMLTDRTQDQDLVDIRRAAQDLIESRDAASADYLKCYYDIDWADPLLYHLIINTSKVGYELAAELIGEAAVQLQTVQPK
ncbi:MAG: cytidylate kinase-like family protein [Chloroflexi bacterium]|nr:cytidylate kinase-like family protein [Chloroflexota bacterium]